MENLKQIINIYCGVDGERLKLVKGKYSIYYRCPKYEKDNRDEYESVCTNNISLKDKQYICSIIQEKYNQGLLRENYEHNYMHIRFRIVSINKNEIKVLVINKKKIKF